MSRSGYVDGDDDFEWGRWRAAVRRSIRGKRGQVFLRDLIEALDAMPVKRLVSGGLVTERGCCAMGAVALHRKIPREEIGELSQEEDVDGWVDEMDRSAVGDMLNIAPALAAEVAYENDECGPADETDEQRWCRLRAWAVRGLAAQTSPKAGEP